MAIINDMCDELVPKVISGELMYVLDKSSVDELHKMLVPIESYQSIAHYSFYFEDQLHVKIYSPDEAVHYLRTYGIRKRLSIKLLIINSSGAYLDCELLPYIEDKHQDYPQPPNLQLPIKNIVGIEVFTYEIPYTNTILTGSYEYTTYPLNLLGN